MWFLLGSLFGYLLHALVFKLTRQSTRRYAACFGKKGKALGGWWDGVLWFEDEKSAIKYAELFDKDEEWYHVVDLVRDEIVWELNCQQRDEVENSNGSPY